MLPDHGSFPPLSRLVQLKWKIKNLKKSKQRHLPIDLFFFLQCFRTTSPRGSKARMPKVPQASMLIRCSVAARVGIFHKWEMRFCTSKAQQIDLNIRNKKFYLHSSLWHRLGFFLSFELLQFPFLAVLHSQQSHEGLSPTEERNGFSGR